MINEIFNGDSASEIRAKLNEMITIINYYSSSQFVGGPGGDPYTPPAGGGGADSVSLWSNGMASLSPEIDPSSACSTINMGYSNSAYISKDPMNMGGTAVPEMGDSLYEDMSVTMPLQAGYYGWYDMANMQNKSIEVTAGGMIMTITTCA